MVHPGGDMQHPYINFGPIQEQQDEGTMPPALPPKRSSRSHPGSFRSDGIDPLPQNKHTLFLEQILTLQLSALQPYFLLFGNEYTYIGHIVLRPNSTTEAKWGQFAVGFSAGAI